MKKTLLIPSMLLLMFAAIAQNQVSELQKGMVFHAPLNENYPNVDLVSGARSTNTAVYNVPDRQGSGANRYYSFNGTSDYVTLPTIPAFGTGDFTVVMKFTTKAIQDQLLISGTGTTYFGIWINSSGFLYITTGMTDFCARATLTISANKDYLFTYKKASGQGTYSITVDGVTTSNTVTDTNNYTTSPTYLGNTTYFFSGSISLVRIFNYALTPTQIANYSKPEYPIEYSDRDGAGNLCVLNLAAEGLAKASDGSYNVGYWTDRVNSITATVSGAASVIPPASCLNAAFFNGSTSNISLTGMNGMTGDITISFWTLQLANGSAGYNFLLSNSKLSLYNSVSSGNLYFNRDNSTSITASSVLPANIWKHILITSTSTGVTNIYIDNVLAASGSAGTPSSATTFVIGSNTGNSAWCFGLMSNVIIWSRILDKDQISLLYQLGH